MKDAAQPSLHAHPHDAPGSHPVQARVKPTAVPSSEWTAVKSTSPLRPTRQPGSVLSVCLWDNGHRISTLAGDNVQTVEPWKPPKTWEGLDSALLNRILDDIEAGCPGGTSRYSTAASAEDRAAGRVVVKHAPDKAEKQAREIIATWVKSGTLFLKEYTDTAARKQYQGLWVNPNLRPS